jgi:hypothetical protein
MTFLFSEKVRTGDLKAIPIDIEMFKGLMTYYAVDISWDVNFDKIFTKEACSHPSSYGCFQINEYNDLRFIGYLQNVNIDESINFQHNVNHLGHCHYRDLNEEQFIQFRMTRRINEKLATINLNGDYY